MALDNKIFEQHLPDKNLRISEQHLFEFFNTMYHRQEIWYNRNILNTSRPWCNDDILNNYKFCNAYRELDRNSQWIINNVIRTDKSLINKLWSICIFRLFNTIEVFEVIDFPDFDDYDSEFFINSIIEIEKYFPSTNKKAYAINSWLAKGTTQGIACAKIIMPQLHKIMPEIMFHGFVGKSSIKDLIKTMTSCEGIGKFVSHEYFVDMCYIDKYSDNSDFMFNENTWTNIGEGASNGIRLIMPSMPNNLKTIKEIQEISKEVLPDDFKYVEWNKETKRYDLCDNNITCTNIEFWLCEYQKYWKIKNKIGKQRDIFKPKIA